MKFLFLHNKYTFRGGEETIVGVETGLLREKGHEIVEYYKDNLEIENFSHFKKASMLWTTSWNRESYNEIKEMLVKHKPDVAHFHNILPQISPSAYYACKAEGVPMVQTLHNYRMICPDSQLLRDGAVCELCPADGLQNSLVYKCYRGSVIQTATVAMMIKYHRYLGTWNNIVDRYIASSQFLKSKLVEYGLPEKIISVKPNFIPEIERSYEDEGYAVFPARISKEKGIETLLKAWRMIKKDHRLKVLGDGPLAPRLKAEYSTDSNISFLGKLDRDGVMKELAGCRTVILPAIWYENCPMTVIEAYANGKPVIGANIGALGEMIDHGATGFHTECGNENDLAEKIETLMGDKKLARRMGDKAREKYETVYNPESAYKSQMKIYEETISGRKI